MASLGHPHLFQQLSAQLEPAGRDLLPLFKLAEKELREPAQGNIEKAKER